MKTEGEPLRLLLVEDDDGDAVLVEELLAEAGLSPDLTRAWSLEAALDALAVPVDCVLLDLGLPDATGLDALVRLREASDAALVVLTGFDGIDGGVEAVAAGAQDYLIKGRVDGESLGRAVRYAVERRGARKSRSQEGAETRLEELSSLVEHLRPPLTRPAGVHTTSRTAGAHDPLSTDLWEVVERPDGTAMVLFGAAAGAGPRAAARTAVLRASFHSLVLAGLGLDGVLGALERATSPEDVPVHAVVIDLDPAGRRVTILEAGHPAPLHLRPAGVTTLAGDVPGRPLGSPGPHRFLEVELAADDRLLLLGPPSPQTEQVARASTGSELLTLLAAADDDDAVCDVAVRALSDSRSEEPSAQVALLGWSRR